MKTGGTKKKPLTEVESYLCEQNGHYARDCPQRKSSSEKVHVSISADKGDSDESEWGVALVASEEKCCFTRYDVLLDNEASLNIFSNPSQLTDIRKATRSVKVSGIHLGSGVNFDREVEFGELGTVFYSGSAAANILSFASQVDAGAMIRYDYEMDVFTLPSKGSDRTYRFGRKAAKVGSTHATGAKSKPRSRW